MDKQTILDEMLELLELNGVQIRTEPLGGAAGGLCSIKGKKTFFLDTQAQIIDTLEACADAVAKTVDIEKIYIKPQIRQFIESYINNQKE